MLRGCNANNGSQSGTSDVNVNNAVSNSNVNMIKPTVSGARFLSLGKLSNLSLPLSPYLQNGINNIIYRIGL